MGFLDSALTRSNPLVRSPFNETNDQGQDFPPPESAFRITDGSDQRITDLGEKRITDN